jgi:hypothetical protein
LGISKGFSSSSLSFNAQKQADERMGSQPVQVAGTQPATPPSIGGWAEASSSRDEKWDVSSSLLRGYGEVALSNENDCRTRQTNRLTTFQLIKA